MTSGHSCSFDFQQSIGPILGAAGDNHETECTFVNFCDVIHHIILRIKMFVCTRDRVHMKMGVFCFFVFF